MLKKIHELVAEQLDDNSIDIAESIVQKDNPAIDCFIDELMDKYGIELDRKQAEDLLENCHSAVTEAIVAWAKENSLEQYEGDDYSDPDEE